MKKRGKKRLLAVILAVSSMVSAGLSGCSGISEIGKTAAEDIRGTSADGSAAKGRFMEEEIELPEEIRENGLIDVVKYPGGDLDFAIPLADGTARHYLYGKTGWRKGDEVTALLGVEPTRMFLGEDQNLYYGGFDGDYAFHVWKIGENEEAEELFSEVFAVPEGSKYGIIPDYLAALPDGSLLVSQTSEASLYSPDGKKKCALPQDFVGTEIRIPAAISGTDYYTFYNQEIVRYDLASGRESGSCALPVKRADGFYGWNFFADETFLYAAGQAGLYRVEKDGTMWEQLIDGSLTSMSRQDLYLRKFCRGTERDYYGIYSGNGNSKMYVFHYYFDETVDAVPPETLTIYALRDHPTVRQAAAVLQKKNPQLRVDFRVAVEDPEEEVTEDVIRALNTELLNGKGADVLILDGLPAETYREKRILADLSAVLSDIKGDLLPDMTANYLDEEGKYYYLPARIKLPVLFGTKEGCDAFTSLEKMEAWQGAESLFAPDIYENILRLTAHTCYGEIFEPSGKVREGMIDQWLSAVKSAGEKGHVKTAFTESEMNRLNVNNYVLPDGFGRQGGYNLVLKRGAAAAELLWSLESAIIPLAAAEKSGYEVSDLNKMYLPCVTAGINAASVNPEAAGQFLRVLFGSEVQNESLSDGFPVRIDSLESWVETEKEISESWGMNGANGEALFLSGEWPKRQVREKLIGLVRTASVPSVPDEAIIRMVSEGAKDYLDGNETKEQAVQAIENKIQLYFSERE